MFKWPLRQKFTLTLLRPNGKTDQWKLRLKSHFFIQCEGPIPPDSIISCDQNVCLWFHIKVLKYVASIYNTHLTWLPLYYTWKLRHLMARRGTTR